MYKRQAWDSTGTLEGGGQGTLRLPLGRLGATLSLEVVGLPDGRHESLALHSSDGARVLPLHVRTSIIRTWMFQTWRLPEEWRGTDAVLVAEDRGAEPWQWIGLRLPKTGVAGWRSANGNAFIVIAVASVLTLLPFAAAFVFLERRYAGDRVLHLVLALAASGVHALVTFFSFFLHHDLGRLWVAGTGVAIAIAVFQGWRSAALRAAARAGLLAVLLVLTVLGITFAYGGADAPQTVPADRHDFALPPDNELPFLLSEKIYNQQPLRPFFEDWLTSDRPPLQSAYRLFSRGAVSYTHSDAADV